MKRILLALMGLFCCALTCLAGTIPITGTIRNADGSRFNGTVRMTLNYPARDTTANNIVVPQTSTFRVNNGSIQGGATITPNDILQPQNTIYVTEYFTSAGQKVMQNNFYVATAAQFDLGSATPTTLTSSNISFSSFTGLSDVETAIINNTQTCTRSGTSGGAKMSAALGALPSTGGVVDCRGLQGAQSLNSDIFTSVTKPVRILWGSGTWSAAVSLTIPSNITIEFGQGGILSMAGATTATINGEVRGTMSQHFAGSGSVIMGGATGSSSAPNVPFVYPQWWGAKADGSTDDLAALNSAFAASKFVKGQGQYRISGPLTIPNTVSFSGPLPGNSQNFMAVRCDGVKGFTETSAHYCVGTNNPAGSYINIEGLTVNTVGISSSTYVAMSITGMSETSTIKNLSFYIEGSAAGQTISKVFSFQTFGPLSIDTVNLAYPGGSVVTVTNNPIDILANAGLELKNLNYTIVSPKPPKVVVALFGTLTNLQLENHATVNTEPCIDIATSTDGISLRDSRCKTTVANSKGIRITTDASPQRAGYVIENVTMDNSGGSWTSMVVIKNMAGTERAYDSSLLVTASTATMPTRIMRFTPTDQVFGGSDSNYGSHSFRGVTVLTTINSAASFTIPFNPRVEVAGLGPADMLIRINSRPTVYVSGGGAGILAWVQFVDLGGSGMYASVNYIVGSSSTWGISYNNASEDKLLTITNNTGLQQAQVIVTTSHSSMEVWP